jgi:P pilus assembly chaperone PapD
MLSSMAPALPAAAASQSITLSPTSRSLTIQPGDQASGKLKVLNQGTNSLKLKFYASSYHVSGENYDQSFTPLPGAPDVASWFKLGLSQTSLAAGSQLDVSYTINVPAGTPAGGYYAVAFAEASGPTNASKTGVVVSQRVGTIFYLTVGGDLEAKGSVLTWETRFLQQPPLSANLRVANSGSIHFPVTFTTTVKDVLGRTKFTSTTQKEILPQTIRNIKVNWPQTPAIGLVKVGGSVQYLGHTHYLPSRWVLVMSSTARLIVALLVALLIIWTLVPVVKRRKTKNHYKK